MPLPEACPAPVVPSKYQSKAEPLDLMPDGPIDDADALGVINGNYAKYHLLDIRYNSLLDWANGLNEKSPND